MWHSLRSLLSLSRLRVCCHVWVLLWQQHLCFYLSGDGSGRIRCNTTRLWLSACGVPAAYARVCVFVALCGIALSLISSFQSSQEVGRTHSGFYIYVPPVWSPRQRLDSISMAHHRHTVSLNLAIASLGCFTKQGVDQCAGVCFHLSLVWR